MQSQDMANWAKCLIDVQEAWTGGAQIDVGCGGELTLSEEWSHGKNKKTMRTKDRRTRWHPQKDKRIRLGPSLSLLMGKPTMHSRCPQKWAKAPAAT